MPILGTKEIMEITQMLEIYKKTNFGQILQLDKILNIIFHNI